MAEEVSRRNVPKQEYLNISNSRYYVPLFASLAILFPVLVPYYFWNECLWISFWTCFVCRFCTTLNIAFFVNSVAHMYGAKPYDRNIMPVENIFVAITAMGEGFHNYHVRPRQIFKNLQLNNETFV